MIEVKILADSMAPCGKRITTKLWTYPRAIHSEILTHRAFARNAASSRAIPVAKLIERVKADPWIPSYIGANQRGMQAGEELNEEKRATAVLKWLSARDAAVEHAEYLAALGVSKQVVNRILEPWMWVTVVVTATDWNNFYALRDHEMAEPHFQELARKDRAVHDASIPRVLRAGEWHLPFVEFDDEIEVVSGDVMTLVRASVGRCARVSYLTHEGKRDIAADVGLHDRLIVQNPAHASPAEHPAMALDKPERHGCLTGWKSYRMTLPNESVPG